MLHSFARWVKKTEPRCEGPGLSLSHDIVVTGHQGSMRVESEHGEHTEVVITLPRQPLLR
jgi:signal transduction histidine kinase